MYIRYYLFVQTQTYSFTTTLLIIIIQKALVRAEHKFPTKLKYFINIRISKY